MKDLPFSFVARDCVDPSRSVASKTEKTEKLLNDLYYIADQFFFEQNVRNFEILLSSKKNNPLT